jgi:hypothetical protein
MGPERTNNNGRDLPPEYYHYHDEGCEFGESCLNCPLPICIYEEPGGKRSLLKRQRDREMARLYKTEGKKVGELAQIFRVSERTVQRALKEACRDSEGGAKE